MAALTRLPPATAERLRATALLGSLAQVAEELALNAAQAGAQAVTLTLHADGVVCEDDGAGFSAAALSALAKPEAGLGRGVLRCAAQVAAVRVLSRAAGSFDTHQLLVDNGQTQESALATCKRPPGATVSVTAFLARQPVRHRALLADTAGEAQRCRGRLQAFSLAHPALAVTLRAGASTLLVCEPARTLLSTLMAQTGALCGLAGEEVAELQAAEGAVTRVVGALTVPWSGAGARTADAGQHVFVAGRALRRCALHSLLDAMFTAAAAVAGSAAADGASARRPARLAAPPARHAVFALHIGVAAADVHLASEPEGSVAVFADESAVVHALVTAALRCWAAAGVSPEALRAAECAAAMRSAAPPPPHRRLLAPAPPPPPVWPPVKPGSAPSLLSPSAVPLPPPLPRWAMQGAPAKAAAPACPPGCSCVSSLDSWRRKRVAVAEPPADSVAAALAVWQNPSWRTREQSDRAHSIATAASLRLAPAELAATELERARLVGQTDGPAFMLAVTPSGKLLVIDPHAAHERVRLEALEEENRAVHAASLPSVRVPLTPSEAAAAGTHAALLRAAGWAFEPLSDGAVVTAAPVCAGVQLGGADFAEHCACLSSAGRVGGAMPPAARRVLASRACKGAVKLGPRLGEQDAHALLAALAGTHQALLCAHGRPTAAPLADLAALEQALAAAEVQRTVVLDAVRLRALARQ